MHRTLLRHPTLLIALSLVLLAGACGDDDVNTEAATSSETTATTSPPVECDGEPIRFTKIENLSGALEIEGRREEVENGLRAALDAVNRECTAGRPIEVEVCDDKSDPNESTACGRQAAENGSIAILGNTGSSDNGVTTSGLPGIMLDGTGLFDLSNPLAYSSANVAMQILGLGSAAAGAGKTHMVIVVPELPAAQLIAGIAVDHAVSLGLEAETVFFPADTTDYTAVAAQIAGIGPDAIGIVVPAAVPFVTALVREGITPDEVGFFGGVDLFPPSALEELDGQVDGAYLISSNVPAQDEEHPGIQQMREEWEAAGIEAPFEEAGTIAVANWSKVHSVAAILGGLPQEQIDSLTPESLVAALEAAGPFEPLVSSPFDFSNPHALPDVEALAAFRIFGSQAMILRVVDGTYERITDFEPVDVPFPLPED